MFSKACMYAIRATVLLASDEAKGVRWTLSAIVEETGAPEAFMASILRKLVRAGILRSVKGPGGGFDMLPGRAGIAAARRGGLAHRRGSSLQRLRTGFLPM